MKDKDTHILEETYQKMLSENYGKRVVLDMRVNTPLGNIKLQLVYDREWQEWQILTLKQIGTDVNGKPRFKAIEDLMAPVADKEDGIGTMKAMIKHIETNPTVYFEAAFKDKPTTLSSHFGRVQQANEPIDIFKYVSDWEEEGYALALISPNDIVVDAYIDPFDYPDMILSKSGDGAKVIDGTHKDHWIKFHSGSLGERIGKDWAGKDK